MGSYYTTALDLYSQKPSDLSINLWEYDKKDFASPTAWKHLCCRAESTIGYYLFSVIGYLLFVFSIKTIVDSWQSGDHEADIFCSDTEGLYIKNIKKTRIMQQISSCDEIYLHYINLAAGPLITKSFVKEHFIGGGGFSNWTQRYLTAGYNKRTFWALFLRLKAYEEWWA